MSSSHPMVTTTSDPTVQQNQAVNRFVPNVKKYELNCSDEHLRYWPITHLSSWALTAGNLMQQEYSHNQFIESQELFFRAYNVPDVILDATSRELKIWPFNNYNVPS
jgi:hypothetical protein